MVKTIVRVLLMSGLIAVATTATQASQAAEQDGVSNSNREQKSIVGAWMGILDNGERILVSLTSDGFAFSSVQSEVKLTGPVLTPAHGVWAHLGGRQFAMTNVVILYDIQTGQYQGSGQLRASLTLGRSGDRIEGTAKVDIFGPDGSLLVTFPHTLRLTRIKVELLD